MTFSALAQAGLLLLAVRLLAAPLGEYLARVFDDRARGATRLFGPLERLLLRLAGDAASKDSMSWQGYAAALLAFNAAGMLLLYALLRAQALLPLNPGHHHGLPPLLALNTAVSFVTNTNWQAYAAETTVSHLAQAAGLAVWNFLSAATGLAALAAIARGFAGRDTTGLGNFWRDLVRVTVHVLLPLSLVLALVLVSQGVVQSWSGEAPIAPLQPAAMGTALPLGPVASQVAIKQLGTNGGGFYNANSAHPFENPTPLSNFLECLAILLLPAACCFAFGALVRDRRQGRALFAVMLVIFLPLMLVALGGEQASIPALTQSGVDQAAGPWQGGGHLEGKEVRFGAGGTALWAAATTAASNGSVNGLHGSLTPAATLVTLGLMQTGEVVFGGVGSGVYGLLAFLVIAVFLAGLMIGRAPEYLGKKLEAREMKLAALAILLPAAAVLLGTAVACAVPAGAGAVLNPGARAFSEILYAFTSGANNNGSALAGLDAARGFYTVGLAIAMLVGRYWVIVPMLALAGSLACRKAAPPSSGSLSTHAPLFVLFLAATVLIVGALTFAPALALGPVVEMFRLGAS